MKAIVVYESLWGNTATIARAIAAGLGPDVPALSTGEATRNLVAGADLIVAGSPVHDFSLPSERSRERVRMSSDEAPGPAELSQPTLRSWLQLLPAGAAFGAAFDTQVRDPFGNAAPAIAHLLDQAGYRVIAPPEKFIVSGKYGPLRRGEIERARIWGHRLIESLGQAQQIGVSRISHNAA
jgi:hypothetical protein